VRSLCFAAEAPTFCRVVYHECTGCHLPWGFGLSILNALLGAFKLAELHCNSSFSREDCSRFCEELNCNLVEPPQAIFAECSRTRSLLPVLRYNQHAHFCNRVLYWNIRLQCNVTRLRVPPPLPPRLHSCLVAPGASASNALSLTASQHLRLLCLSGHALLLLRLLMLDPVRRNMCHRECHHRTLKRICGGAVAAHMVGTTVPCVNIRTQGQPDGFIHSLLANPSDTVGAVKAKFLSVISCQSQSHLLDFHFAGRELGHDHASLSFFGVKPNDTIDMTFGMKIFVRSLAGPVLVICAEPSDSINCIKMKIWFKTGIPPQECRLIFSGTSLEDGRTLSDYNIGQNCTLMLLRRLVWGF
jgi:hypothetical protein